MLTTIWACVSGLRSAADPGGGARDPGAARPDAGVRAPADGHPVMRDHGPGQSRTGPFGKTGWLYRFCACQPSGWQAAQGVQLAALASGMDFLAMSASSMKRMRMQSGSWYLGTPGMTVTSLAPPPARRMARALHRRASWSSCPAGGGGVLASSAAASAVACRRPSSPWSPPWARRQRRGRRVGRCRLRGLRGRPPRTPGTSAGTGSGDLVRPRYRPASVPLRRTSSAWASTAGLPPASVGVIRLVVLEPRVWTRPVIVVGVGIGGGADCVLADALAMDLRCHRPSSARPSLTRLSPGRRRSARRGRRRAGSAGRTSSGAHGSPDSARVVGAGDWSGLPHGRGETAAAPDCGTVGGAAVSVCSLGDQVGRT